MGQKKLKYQLKVMYNKNIFNFTVCLSNASTHCSTANPSETKHDYYSDIILWKKKYSNTRAFEKVKRTVVCSSTEEGGINMINVHDMQASFVLAWATTLKQPGNENWKLIPRTLFNLLGSDLACFQATAPPKHFLGIERIRSKFWQCSLVKWVD